MVNATKGTDHVKQGDSRCFTRYYLLAVSDHRRSHTNKKKRKRKIGVSFYIVLGQKKNTVLTRFFFVGMGWRCPRRPKKKRGKKLLQAAPWCLHHHTAQP